MRVAHVITGLGVGGAETMLSRLLDSIDSGQVESRVVVLSHRGPMAERIEESGVQVESLGMSPGVPLRGLSSLRQVLARFEPALVQTWMYHADLLGGLAARSIGRPSVWSLRQSHVGREVNRLSTMLVMTACARLSGALPAKIVCGSEAARRAHERIGYASEKMVVIPNGFDTTRFRPDASARSEIRRELSIDSEAPVVALVARYHVQKDHQTFLSAARAILNRYPNAIFVLCGQGIDESNRSLVDSIRAMSIEESVRLLGRRDDIHRLTTAFDIAVSSSIGEGLPNAIGEAMACGVPCVVTDVGDSKRLVADTGLVIPPRDPISLAKGVVALLDEGPEMRSRRGRDARARIEHHFGIEQAAAAHLELWREVVEAAN